MGNCTVSAHAVAVVNTASSSVMAVREIMVVKVLLGFILMSFYGFVVKLVAFGGKVKQNIPNQQTIRDI